MLINVKSLLIILIISSSVISVVRKIKLKTVSNMKIQAKSNGGDNTGGDKTGEAMSGYAQVCFAGLASAMPQDFCWKKGGDFGKIPTNCPNNYERILALCFEKCKPGYKHFLGVCWREKCDQGYTEHRFTCFKNVIKWYFKNAYIPNSLTKFNKLVTCPDGMHQTGALCYRNCPDDMVSCGIGACAKSNEDCANTLFDMTLNTAFGIGQLALFIGTFGASTTATPALKSSLQIGMQNLKKNGLKFIVNKAKDSLTKFKAQTLSNAYKKTKELLKNAKDKVKEVAKNFAVEKFCKEIYEQSISKFDMDNFLKKNHQ